MMAYYTAQKGKCLVTKLEELSEVIASYCEDRDHIVISR